MKVTNLNDAQPRPRKAAIGMFDGIHTGHRKVIGSNDTVLTFNPHPLTVLAPASAPKLLTTFERKCELIAELGVSELVVIPFDYQFSHLTAERFISEVLIDKLSVKEISVGENFRFGEGARGTTDLLAQTGAFSTNVVQLAEENGQVISSSYVRALVMAGDVEHVIELLTRPFRLTETVVKGDQRGRELGFPTANLVPDPAYICPANGVYAAFANGYPAAVSVGVRPTFKDDGEILVEAYLIDQSFDLYGQELKVDFIRRLRAEQTFASAEELIEQMRLDVQAARECCQQFSPSK